MTENLMRTETHRINSIEGVHPELGRYEILWDKNTVWVNTISCIARLGKLQGELYYSEKNGGDCVSKESFVNWRQRVQDTFGIEVPMQAIPMWSLAESMVTPIRCGGLDYKREDNV